MGKKKEKMGRFYLKDTRNRQITADKREIENFLKLPSATSFIRKTLYAIAFWTLNRVRRNSDDV